MVDDSRTRILLGNGAVETLARSRILCLGLGGVGGAAVEMLTRMGVGDITLVDGDVFSPGNINRQLGALDSTVGRKKAEVWKERCLEISPECKFTAVDRFIRTQEDIDELLSEPFDAVIDAIDEVKPKIDFLVSCVNRGIFVYDPGRDVQCFVSCLRHERGDQMLDGVETLLEECGIDGVYLDGPTVAFSCDNPGHDCRDSLPAVWDDDYNSGRILGQRAFLKRLRGIFDAKGIKYPLWSHTGGDIFTSTLSLADYYYDGEQMSRFRDGYLVEPEKFRINFALSGLGVRGRFLPILYFDSTWTNRQSLPIALVHATETSSLEKQHPLVDFFFRYLRQEDPAEFYPYWEEQPHWQVTADETVFASYLRNDTEGVLVISNLYQDGEKEVSIELGDFFDGEDFAIACLTNPGAAFVQEGSKITFRLKPATMKVFYITTNDSFPEDMPSPERAVGNTAPADPIPQNQVFNDADWVITPGMLQSDGSIHFPADRTAAASVAYNGRLPEPFTVRMTLEHSSALNFYVDEIKFTYNKGTGWLIRGVDEYENEDYCAVSHKGHRGGHEALNRPVELVISMEDDHLNVAYDGARLLHYALPAVDNASHTIKVEAPAGSDVKLQLQEIKNEGEIPFSDFEIMHPVL